MKRYLGFGILALVLALALAACGGGPLTLKTTLSGANEVPAVTTSATGAATVVLNESAKTVTVTGTFTGLSGNATAAHVHGPAAKGVNAGIVFNLTPTSAASGTLSGTSPVLTDQQISDFKNKLWYVNVHTAANPNGEIRGQLE